MKICFHFTFNYVIPDILLHSTALILVKKYKTGASILLGQNFDTH